MEDRGHIDSLPDEILLHLFSYLDGASFARIQRVCLRWRLITEQLQCTRFNEVWKRLTLKDFGQCDTVNNCSKHMDWFQMYSTLYMWLRIEVVPYKCHEVVASPNCKLHVVNVQRDKLIAVSRDWVQIFGLNDYASCYELSGEYIDYQMNDISRIVSTPEGGLFVTGIEDKGKKLFFEPVEVFLLDKETLYYRIVNDGVYKVDLNSGDSQPKLIVLSSVPFFGSLSIVNGNLYTRTSKAEICIDSTGISYNIESPYNREQIAGVLATFCPFHANTFDYNNKQRVEFMRKAFKDNKGFANVFNAASGNRSEQSIDERRITSARIYNDMLMVGTVDSVLQIFRIDDLQLVREVKMPHSSLGILDMKIHETTKSCEIIVLAKEYVNVVKFSCSYMAQAMSRQ